MIRIDEYYLNVFWQYFSKHIPQTRVFYCDPPGSTDPDTLYNYGVDDYEDKFIFMHDQEPVHLPLHDPLFYEVYNRNYNLSHGYGPMYAAIVTSEWNSENVEKLCAYYDWKSYYYFYHGWACLDWYRGYDKTFLLQPYRERKIKHSFISANRIIGGHRDHRLLLLYHIAKQNTTKHLVSFPDVCPAEQEHILDLVTRFEHQHPDIKDVIGQLDLPWNMPNEEGHPMHSCWLSLFDEHASSLVDVVTETVFFGRRNHITEKTFKPICMKQPFIIVSCAHSLEYLRKYGFKTFSDFWDESYDQEEDDFKRLEMIGQLLKEIDSKTEEELQELHLAMEEVVEYNFNHFYGGAFEEILWAELLELLETLKHDFNGVSPLENRLPFPQLRYLKSRAEDERMASVQ